jgi:hypothetical protein
VRAHIKEQPQAFQRFNASWTPTILIVDPSGKERYRVEGFLPVDDLLAQLELGLARWAFEREDYAEAERLYRKTCESHPKSTGAAEACYWAGVAAYKATHDAKKLNETEKLLKSRYPDSEWAKKASVWAA